MSPPPPPAPAESGPRPNPEVFAGSLIYWAEVPSDKQHFINGILEGYDALGYYQTMEHDYGQGEGGSRTALARITSTEDARGDMEALLESLKAEFGLRLLGEAPGTLPDIQPRSRKPEKNPPDRSRRNPSAEEEAP